MVSLTLCSGLLGLAPPLPPGQGQRAPGVWNVHWGVRGCDSFLRDLAAAQPRLPARGFQGTTAPEGRGRGSPPR